MKRKTRQQMQRTLLDDEHLSYLVLPPGADQELDAFLALSSSADKQFSSLFAAPLRVPRDLHDLHDLHDLRVNAIPRNPTSPTASALTRSV